MNKEDFEKDGGAKSRKLWFSVGTSVIIVLASLVVPHALFGEVVAGLISVNGIYVGGNAAAKWIAARSGKGTPSPEPSPEPELTTKKKKKPVDDTPPIEQEGE